MKKRVDRTLESLKNNNMKGYYIETRGQLFEKLKNLIIENSIIGVGDSITVMQAYENFAEITKRDCNKSNSLNK